MPATEVVVTVQGSASSRHAPELASVRLGVATEGADKAAVHRDTVRVANELADVVRPMAEPGGPVTRWSADRLHSWFDRPWDHHGQQQLDPVFHARAVLRATFHDLDVLGRFLDDVGPRPGVAIEEISWELTEEHGARHAREARQRAVADAAERALDYARAAGFSAVAFVAVADVGLLVGDDPMARAGRGKVTAVSLGASAMDSGGMGFSPEDIVVSAEVEARFLAT